MSPADMTALLAIHSADALSAADGSAVNGSTVNGIVVDARELACPMPLLKAKQALRGLAPGQILLLLATDPGSWRDIAAFAEQSGHALVEARMIENEYVYWLQKSKEQ